MGISKNILIIDDSKSVQHVLKKYLEDFGEYFDFNIVCAFDGLEGLNLCKSRNIDIILLDMVMPKMDGIKFLLNKNKITKLKEIPVIIISTVSNNKVIKTALALGAKTYLLKPVDLVLLKKAVYENCNLRFEIPDSLNRGRTEVYFKDDVIIAEIYDSFEQTFINSIMHKFSELAEYSKSSLKRFLIVFSSIPEKEIVENSFYKMMMFYKDIKGMSQENIKIITDSEKIKTLLQKNINTRDIEVVDSFLDGLQKLNLQMIRNKETILKTDYIRPGMMLFTNMYDEKGNVVKNKGEAFTEEDLEEFKKMNMEKLYYVKLSDIDISVIESPLFDMNTIELPKDKGFLIK